MREPRPIICAALAGTPGKARPKLKPKNIRVAQGRTGGDSTNSREIDVAFAEPGPLDLRENGSRIVFYQELWYRRSRVRGKPGKARPKLKPKNIRVAQGRTGGDSTNSREIDVAFAEPGPLDLRENGSRIVFYQELWYRRSRVRGTPKLLS